MSLLILCRHGQSDWNLQNRFTGWVDVDLSEQGRQEARLAGKNLLDEKITFDVAHTSLLKRAIRTLWIILDTTDRMWVPVSRAWQLNERHYGSLQGLDKAETLERHGADQLKLWRRGYAVRPPALALDDPQHPRFDPRYAEIDPETLPGTESLADTLVRVMAYWNAAIRPQLRMGKNVLVAAHGNSLRALVKHLNHISDDEIAELNIPTGIPLVYEFDANMKVKGSRYLGDPEAVKAAADAVAKQAERKPG